MPRLHALIFDLDGTLVDSAADLRQALNALLFADGRRTLALDEVKSMIGDGMPTLIHRAYAATGAALPKAQEQDIFVQFIELYQLQNASEEQLYPQARETIAAFRAKNIKIGLCTNKPYKPTLTLLRDINMKQMFDYVAGGDSFSVHKPHPGHVLGVANGLDVLPENCAMIGDSINDILAAKNAGIISIAVSHGYGYGVESLGADAVIAGFAELPQALRRLGFDFAD